MQDRSARRVTGAVMTAIALGALRVAHAGSPCDLVTQSEASRLLGVSAEKGRPQAVNSPTPGCLIESSASGDSSLRLTIETIAAADAPRLVQHIDEERGDEKPSMHGESWFEISVPDAKHPDYRRMIVHRSRTSLILDLRSSHQKDAKAAFEKLWYKLSERLPSDDE